MRFAYADPPYPGQAVSRYNGTEVDHAALIVSLRDFDGWALSTSASALLPIWQLAPEARCAAWVKTWATNGWSRVRWSWEPLLFVTPRRGIKPGERSDVWDSHVCAPATAVGSWQEVPGKGGGSKPESFVHWMLDLLGYQEGVDELIDIFPGSGAVTTWIRVRQRELWEAC